MCVKTHTQLTILSKPEEEITILEMVFIYDMVNEVCTNQKLGKWEKRSNITLCNKLSLEHEQIV